MAVKYSDWLSCCAGAAFFVEDVEVEEGEDEDWSPDLATSPIPDQSSWDWAAKRRQVPS